MRRVYDAIEIPESVENTLKVRPEYHASWRLDIYLDDVGIRVAWPVVVQPHNDVVIALKTRMIKFNSKIRLCTGSVRG
jgi:hypothetical protein